MTSKMQPFVIPLLLHVLTAAAPPLPAESGERTSPFLGAYIHMHHSFDARAPRAAREASIRDTLDRFRASGLRAIIPYATTTSGEANYPSRVIAAKNYGDWDPLAVFVEEARARSLQVYPSICVLECGAGTPAGILLAHPEWALRDANGRASGFISPGHPAARDWLASVAAEITSRYRPDGVLLDYLRFPNRAVRLDAVSEAEFARRHPPASLEGDAARARAMQTFKEESLTALARQISSTLRRLQPDIRIAVYSWGPHVREDHPVAQDWETWVAEGLIDMLDVSGYCYTTNDGPGYIDVFHKRLSEAVRIAKSRRPTTQVTFALGVKTSHGEVAAAAQIDEYLSSALNAGVDGVVFYTWSYLQPFLGDVVENGSIGRFRQRVAARRAAAAAREMSSRVGLVLDLGEDRGQNFGSLFEAFDAKGRVVLGAGFQGAYNTYYRSDRHKLHFFVRPSERLDEVRFERLPRPSPDSNVYLFDLDGRVVAQSRGAANRLASWDDNARRWSAAETSGAGRTTVGRRQLEFSGSRVTVDGEPVLELDAAGATSGLHYYAHGHLFFWRKSKTDERTGLHAYAWTPAASTAIDPAASQALELTTPGEFPYSWGQFGKQVLAGTNTGGLYRFEAGGWTTLIEPDTRTSFQLYAMLDYHERLLMGHYPSGEIYEYDGVEARRLPGWPPRPEGTSPLAREAQSLALYRGDLFVGVWPWGEIWRYDREASRWHFVRRMFTQPSLSSSVAPYIDEVARAGEAVHNIWGQRVTSLLPHGDALFVSTGSKGGAPFAPRFDFLGGDARLEYGAVWRLEMASQLSASIEWTGAPTRLEFEAGPLSMRITQDGRELARLRFRETLDAMPPVARIEWGRGVFGPLRGEIEERWNR